MNLSSKRRAKFFRPALFMGIPLLLPFDASIPYALERPRSGILAQLISLQ